MFNKTEESAGWNQGLVLPLSSLCDGACSDGPDELPKLLSSFLQLYQMLSDVGTRENKTDFCVDAELNCIS